MTDTTQDALALLRRLVEYDDNGQVGAVPMSLTYDARALLAKAMRDAAKGAPAADRYQDGWNACLDAIRSFCDKNLSRRFER
jgi:hypothetical protein